VPVEGADDLRKRLIQSVSASRDQPHRPAVVDLGERAASRRVCSRSASHQTAVCGRWSWRSSVRSSHGSVELVQRALGGLQDGGSITLTADYADHVGSARKDSWYAWTNIARTVGLGAGGLITGLVIADGSESAYRVIASPRVPATRSRPLHWPRSCSCPVVARAGRDRLPGVAHCSGTGTFLRLTARS
jgi:hypothetical protein